MGNHGRFSEQKSKRWQKYVDYRKRFKYSVSDGSILAYYNGADYTFTWAWASLAGDVVDLVPFVTGVGETIRGARTAAKIADKADTAKDIVKGTNRASERAKAVRQAWKNEQEDVLAGGKGISREWNKAKLMS